MRGGGSGGGLGRPATAALAALGALVLAQSAYRAVHQSITHDEACTFNWFVARPSNVFNYDPNNHVAFTYLAMASVRLLGASEWSLRAPTLVAAALYALAVVALLGRAMPSRPWALATAALLFGNPLVLDYLTAARGYGLALALLMWAIVLALAALGEPAPEPRARRRWWWASFCLGLCVASSLAFAPVAAGLAGTAGALLACRGGSPRASIPVRAALPGAAVCAAAYFPLAVKVVLARVISSAPAAAARLRAGGWVAAGPAGAPQPGPALVIAASAALAASLAALVLAGLAAGRRLAPRRIARPARRAIAAAVGILAVGAAAALAPTAMRFGRHLTTHYFYTGRSDAGSAVEALAGASFARERAVSQEAAATGGWRGASVAAAALGILLPLAAMLPLLRRARRPDAPGLSTAEIAGCLFAGALASAAIFYVVAHLLIGVHYPPPRAAVYAPPLASAALAFALRARPRRPAVLTGAAALLAATVLGLYARQWGTETFWGTRLDANARAGFESVAASARERGGGAARFGGSWVFEPSMTFYRAVRHEERLTPYERVETPEISPLDFIVCRPGAAPDPANGVWRPLYRDPVAGVTFMARAPGGGG